jgi:hypothetical protein
MVMMQKAQQQDWKKNSINKQSHSPFFFFGARKYLHDDIEQTTFTSRTNWGSQVERELNFSFIFMLFDKLGKGRKKIIKEESCECAVKDAASIDVRAALFWRNNFGGKEA